MNNIPHILEFTVISPELEDEYIGSKYELIITDNEAVYRKGGLVIQHKSLFYLLSRPWNYKPTKLTENDNIITLKYKAPKIINQLSKKD